MKNFVYSFLKCDSWNWCCRLWCTSVNENRKLVQKWKEARSDANVQNHRVPAKLAFLKNQTHSCPRELSLPNSNPDLVTFGNTVAADIITLLWHINRLKKLFDLTTDLRIGGTYLFWAFPYSPNGSPAIPPSPVKMYKYPSSANRSCPPLWFDAGSSISRITLEGSGTTIN